jgi:hypothetical protein
LSNPFAGAAQKLDNKHGALFAAPAAAAAGAGEEEDAEEEHEVEIKKEDALVTLPEVEKVTGEEGETRVLEIDPFKVFLFDAETKEWKDKGGLCYARLLSSEEGSSFKARIVVRRKNNEEVVLNAAVHSGMKPDKQADNKSTKVFTFNSVRPALPRSRIASVSITRLNPFPSLHLQETGKLDMHLLKVCLAPALACLPQCCAPNFHHPFLLPPLIVLLLTPHPLPFPVWRASNRVAQRYPHPAHCKAQVMPAVEHDAAHMQVARALLGRCSVPRLVVNALLPFFPQLVNAESCPLCGGRGLPPPHGDALRCRGRRFSCCAADCSAQRCRGEARREQRD